MGEMKHADWIIERVLTLDGLPNLQDLGKLKIGEDVLEMFTADLGLEMTNQSCLKIAINVCEDKNDYVSRDIFLKILDDETTNEMPLNISLRTTSDEGNPIVHKEPNNSISKKYMEIGSKILSQIQKNRKQSPQIIQ